MFERWTDRARRAVVLAQEECRIARHPAIDPGHLLLGLIHEDEGVAAQVLRSCGVTLENARGEVNKRQGPAGETAHSSPPFTVGTKEVFQRALREALQLGCSYISTEHMLLGIISRGDGTAVESLVEGFGLDLSEIRRAVLELLASYDKKPAPQCETESGGLLTAGEHLALDLCARLSRVVHQIITADDGVNAANDWNEACSHIHAVQRMIGAQAAARAYPERYRLLGQRFAQ